MFNVSGSSRLSASDVAKLEQDNARLAVALDDSYAALGETRTALARLQGQYDSLEYELDWFKRPLFGQKSEKRLDIDPAQQLNLLAGLGVKAPPSCGDAPTRTGTYERRAKVRDARRSPTAACALAPMCRSRPSR